MNPNSLLRQFLETGKIPERKETDLKHKVKVYDTFYNLNFTHENKASKVAQIEWGTNTGFKEEIDLILLLNIFSFIFGYKNAKTLQLVCKNWNYIINSRYANLTLFRPLAVETYPNLKKVMEHSDNEIHDWKSFVINRKLALRKVLLRSYYAYSGRRYPNQGFLAFDLDTPGKHNYINNGELTSDLDRKNSNLLVNKAFELISKNSEKNDLLHPIENCSHQINNVLDIEDMVQCPMAFENDEGIGNTRSKYHDHCKACGKLITLATNDQDFERNLDKENPIVYLSPRINTGPRNFHGVDVILDN